MRALLLLLLLLPLASPRLLMARTYTVGQYGEHGTGLRQDVTLGAGDSLCIAPYAVYSGRVTFQGTGQRIVNDWIWLAPPLHLPPGATFTNNYLCTLEWLAVGPGATFHNAGECAVTALDIAAGGTVQNDAPAWLQVYSAAFTNEGLIRNCGVLLAVDWARGGRVVGCGPLPVELVRFTATAGPGAVALRWAVAQEVNVARYEVEQSGDGLRFARGPVVPATGAATYAATAPLPGAPAYYRLRVVDLDGTYAFSPVVVLLPARPARVVSLHYADALGRALAAPPAHGFFIEVVAYDDGTRTRRKIYQE